MEKQRTSLFYIWSFIPVINSISFLHASLITRNFKYLIFAPLYFVSNFLIDVGTDPAMAVWFLMFVASIFHVQKIRNAVDLEWYEEGLKRGVQDKDHLEKLKKINEKYGVSDETSPLQSSKESPRVVERIIIKEIVKIPCSYCNTLVENTESQCPQCGGDIR
jgi:hypothetical protein